MMDILYNLLKENIELYNNFLELENEKYEAALKDDISTMDDIVSKEQAYYLQMRGLENKRDKVLKDLGFNDKTLKEIIELSENEQKLKLTEMYDELNRLIKELKKIKTLCKNIFEVRIHRVDRVMKQLGEKENAYSSKSLILSKKI